MSIEIQPEDLNPGEEYEIPEEQVKKNFDVQRDKYIREAILDIFSSKDGQEFISDMASSEPSEMFSKGFDVYNEVRDHLAKKEGYEIVRSGLRSEYFNKNGAKVDMEGSYTDKAIAKLMVEHINRLGFNAPKGAEKLIAYFSKE